MNTNWHQRRFFEERLAEGKKLTVEEVRELIDDADEGQRYQLENEALRDALFEHLNLVVVDATTDDDPEGERKLLLVEAEEEDGADVSGC